MKKLLLLLAFSIVSNLTIAQSFGNKALNSGKSELKKELSDEQIKDAIEQDSELEAKVIDHLKSDPKANPAVKTIENQNKGDKKGFLKSLLKDKKLGKMAVDFVRKNPQLLEKAMRTLKLKK